MKKLSKKHMENMPTLQKARERHNIERRSKSYIDDKRRPPPKVFGVRILKIPTYFQFDTKGEYKAIVELMDDINRWSFEDKVTLDFSGCQHANVQALIVLYAHLHMLRDSGDRKLIRVNRSSLKGEVKTLVEASGLREMLLRQEPTNTDVESFQLPIISGDGDSNLPHDQIIDHIQKRLPKGLSVEVERVLGDALSEAFLNVEDHAYPESRLPGLGKKQHRWWTMCSVFDKQLYLAVYDVGVGIPQTIDSNHWLIRAAQSVIPVDAIRKILESDSETIGLAMQAGRNRRNLKKHGQGSISMHELVEQNPYGELWVLSGRGRYHWFQEKGSSKHELKDYPKSIPGTLVQWNVKVE